MKKSTLTIIISIICLYLHADFIVPISDPVYEFLEMNTTLKQSQLNHLQYPLYYNDIIENLQIISNQTEINIYKNIADYHLRRLSLIQEEKIQVAIFPPKKIVESVTSLYREDPQQKRLVVIPVEGQAIYLSGILGYNYDIKTNNNTNRTKRYYGIESIGSFTPNFGYYFHFTKGHYFGDENFIKENPFLSWMEYDYYQDGDRFYQVDLNIEVDFKNPYLNISMGYGSFDIGRSISSSIILNNDVTSYGYIKFNKRFNIFEYTGITSQLIPYRMTEPAEYKSKSMAIQTFSLHTQNVSLGIGNSIIYGNRTFDLAYSTPLAIYKIIDNKYHGFDNGLVFGFAEIRPVSGLNIYANINFDDLRNDRFKSDIWASYSSYQAGILAQSRRLPIEIGGEVTLVGPGMYSHKSRYLDYKHDDRLLGNMNGSNFLSFATRTRLHLSKVSMFFYYENIQQGDKGNLNSINFVHGDMKFLDGNIERNHIFKTGIDFWLIPELNIFTRYDYNKTHYVYTGAEFKY